MICDLAVCILAGGAARRFGSAKGLAALDGTALIDRVAHGLRAQTTGQIALNTDPAGPYSDAAYPVFPDRLAGDLGPLAGIHAAMKWGADRGFDCIATCAIDTPFLPGDMLEKLAASGAPSICSSAGRWHPLIGIWRCDQAAALARFIEPGARSVHAWAEHCSAKIVDFPVVSGGPDPFFNINTQDDLRHAERWNFKFR